jgi:PAS domain S-box-containing protein
MQNQTKTKQQLSDEIAALFAGGGEMGEAIRHFNWSNTPLGSIETWPQSLRTAVSILLNSRYPMVICWGPQLIKFYNDAYKPLLGAMKHPGALGRPMQEVWPELWPIIGSMLHGVMETGEPTFFEDMQFFTDRNGYLEEMFATFSYSAIRDESSKVGGIFAACTETTQTVIGQRRLKTLRNLAARASKTKTVEDACQLTVETLARNSDDIPFALLYLLDAGKQQARLMGTYGCEPGTTATPQIADMNIPEIWPFSEVVRTGQSKTVDDLINRLDCPPKSPWSEPTHTALVLPISQPGQTQPAGLLVVGVSPRHALDEDYRTFFELVAEQIASAIANARAYEEERQQAEAYIQFQANVLAQVNDAVIAIDNEHRITYWNKGAERLYQFATDEATGQQLEGITRYRWLKPEDEQAASEGLATTGSWQGENIHVKRSGEEMYVESSVSILKDERGATTGLLAVIRDISDAYRQAAQRQRAEEVLRRYERIVSATPDGIALLDRNSVYQVVNQTYLDWNVKRYDDIVGHSVSELVGEEVFKTVVKPLLDRCLAGELVRFEAWFNYADGHERFVGMTYAPYVEMNGTISGVVVTGRDLTQLKRAEAALSQSQETVQRQLAEIETIYATAPIGLCLVDTNLRFVRLNEHLAEINGLPVAAHIGRTLREVLPELADELEPTYLQVIQSGLPILDVEVHATAPAQPGLERDWLLSYYPLKDSDGRILGVNVMVQDITDRKQAEEALRQSEARFRAIFEMAGIGIAATAPPDFKLAHTNPVFQRMLGYSAQELANLDYSQITYPDDLATEQSLVQAILEGEGVSYTLEKRYIRKDRQIIWANLTSSIIRDAAGQIQLAFAMAEDITDRKQAEAALRESEERFRQIAETINEVFFINSADLSELLYVSPAYERVWGRPCESLYQQPLSWLEAVHPEDRDQLAANLPRIIRGEPSAQECRIIQPNGSIRWILCRTFPVFDAAGYLLRHVGLAEDITDGKQAEEALRQSEIRFRTIFETAGIGIAVLMPPDFKLMQANLAYQTMLGYSAQELANLNYTQITHPDDLEIELPLIQATLETKGKGHTLEKRYIRKDGQIIWVNLTTSCLWDAAGHNHMAIDVVEDITQRKQAEAALRESEERFRQLAENIDAVFWMTSQDQYQMIYISPAFDRIWGRSRSDLYENSNLYLDSIHPEDLERVTTTVQSSENGYEIEYRILRPDGAIRWIRDRSFPIRNEQGDIYRHAGIAEDITERKQAEQKIREQAALLDVATDAILVGDLDNRILFWNNSAERLYGWKAEEVLGKNANKLLYEVEDISVQLEEIQKTLLNTGEWQGELHQVTRYDKEITVESRWTLVRDEEGHPKSILVVNTDITEKKQLEAQFFRAQRLESIGTLASGIAHDLNNILSPILISAQLLQTRISDARNQKLLKIIETNAKRGSAAIKQVLSFARGVEGERRILQARHLISEIKHIVEETFPKSIEFYTDIAPDLWTVSADATQLHQVLLNLCVNARDAMPDGGTLRISAENLFIDQNYARMYLDARVGPHIVITVADTGTGIPPEIMDRIFEPFFTTKEKGKGTGLGLSTVIGIIKSHGGFVQVSNNVGKGTQFQVFLPAMYETTTLQLEDQELPRGDGELILVVDDEASVIETTTISLEAYNYKAIAARDGIEAIALYAQDKNEISAVLIDMMMPSMDGSTSIRILQQMNPQVKIIAMSGLVSNDEAEAANVSVKAFLSKPFTARELLNTINNVLSVP